MSLRKVLTCLFFLQAGLSLPASAGAPIVPTGSSDPNSGSAEIARLALSENPAESAPAVASLRDQGPAGLDLLLYTYRDEIATYSNENAALRASDPRWVRLTAALDAVSQQRDSYASRLYWYTDFEKAKAAARLTNKPILSLRLLGNLTDELSCANSRFFRTVLYPNAEVSAYLRDHFILHWKSARPAPRITIDFGDGRKIERTITGNSIHYVLDSDGRPIDAIPGLYGPKAFLRELAIDEKEFKAMAPLGPAERAATLRAFHLTSRVSIINEWRTDIARTGVRMTPDDSIAESDGSPKSALEAAPLAVSKMVAEIPTVRSIGTGGSPGSILLPSSLGPGPAGKNPASAAAPTSASPELSAPGAAAWERIASLHESDAKLDASSLVLIRSQYPNSRPTAETFSRIIANLEHNLAIDSVRNRYLIHSRIHQWFVDGTATADVDTLNERVYARLFLTPSSDPWLGLVTPDTYTGLIDDGIIP
ncbi:MAG TPA: hypothetical protein VEZ90_06300 [Blastocatellia bacterium]|nr:hypothetical protein [Blastocatellia bacterium]